MPKKKTYQVTNTSPKKAIGKITKADQLKMVRRARRAGDIASGINQVASGTGAWGGSKEQRKRRERKLIQGEALNCDND